MAVGAARSSKSGGADAVRFEAARSVIVPAHDDVAVLELEGTFHASARRSVGRPRLVVTTSEGSTEIRAVKAQSANAGPKPKRWRASFALSRTIADAEGATFGLAIGRSLVLDLPTPTVERPSSTNTQDELEGQTLGGMIVDLSEARRELAETQDELARAQEEIERLRSEADAARAEAEQETPRPKVTWLEEVEAESATSTNGSGPHDDEFEDVDDDDLDDERDALPVLAGRRLTVPPATAEHEAVYEATLKRMQTERRDRLRRRRLLGRLLALVVFLLAAAAIYIVVTGAVGVDILELF